MRRRFFLLAIALSGVTGAHAQGTVNFANFAAGVNAPALWERQAPPPINYVYGRLAGPDYAAQLYYAAPGTGSNIDSYTPLAGVVPLQSGVGEGYFMGRSTTIPGFGQGMPISIIVAIFSTLRGPDYATSRDNGGTGGFSNPVNVTLGGGVTPPPNLVGLQSVAVPVPEPTAMTFLVTGGLLMLWARATRQRGAKI